MKSCKKTNPHETNQFLVANGFVGFVDRGRAIRRPAIAKTRVSATVVIAALVPKSQLAVVLTTWTLKVEEQCLEFFV